MNLDLLSNWRRFAIELSDLFIFFANGPLKIIWDKSKPSGDKIRLMDITRAKKIGFKTEIDISSGINNTINWYINSKKHKRYNAFTEKF